MKTSRCLWVLFPILAVACSSTSGSPSSSGDGGAGGDGGRPRATQCEPGVDGVFVGRVTGKVLDTSGKPPTATTITICGSACISGKLTPDGTFSVEPSFCYQAGTFYPVPVFIFHGQPDYANVIVDFVPAGAKHLDQVAIDSTVYTIPTAGLPKAKYDEASAFTLNDGKGFTLSAAKGSIVLPFGEENIAVGQVDVNFFPLGKGKGGETLTALYVIVPDESEIKPPATVRFPNTAKLAAGSAVELLAIGNLVTAKMFRSGTLGVIGTGRVTGDGAFVESVPGTDTGLITTGWIGYRPKP